MSRVPLRVRASITWNAVTTAASQNTQVSMVASRCRVANRPSRLRGLGGLRVGADIGGLAYRLSLLSRIVTNENRYVKGARPFRAALLPRWQRHVPACGTSGPPGGTTAAASPAVSAARLSAAPPRSQPEPGRQ